MLISWGGIYRLFQLDDEPNIHLVKENAWENVTIF